MGNTSQSLNRLRVLKVIRQSGPIARSQLPELADLSAGTITQLTGELLQRGLVREAKQPGGRPGRPRSLLQIDAGAAVVLGGSIQRGRMATTFVDLAGEQLFSQEIPTPPSTSLGQLAERAAEALGRAIGASPFSRDQIAGIGLSVPGVADSASGEVHFVATLPSGPVPFSEIVAERLGLPVTLENDQSCLARAEHWFGAAQDLETFGLLHIGPSIKLAEYRDGLPQAGANGLNGEFGHVKIDYSGNARRCQCGGRGCLTAYSSIFGLLQQSGLFENESYPGASGVDDQFEALLDRADLGEKEVVRLLDEAGRLLGRAVANHVTATSPRTLLVSVDDERFERHLVPVFFAELAQHTMPGIRSASWPSALCIAGFSAATW